MTKNTHDKVYQFMKREHLMSLATNYKRPWIVSLYYIVEEDLTLYFISDKSSSHVQHIVHNSMVSCAIAASTQKTMDNREGVQLIGKAKRLMDPIQTLKVKALWKSRFPKFTKFKLDEKHLPTSMLHAYAVIPKEIRYTNQKLYPKEAYTTLTL